jgi:hypothetical protein
MTHPHAPPEASPADGAFLRTFVGTLAGLLLLCAAIVVLVDPLARFGTGLVAPAVTADRDQKARLYRARVPRPQLVVLGSSRSKTLDPACLERITGLPAFNFAVNGGGTDDFLAILRFLRAEQPDSVRWIMVGVEPETMQGSGTARRPLAASRVLAPFVLEEGPGRRLAGLGADLFGWQAASAAVRSLAHLLNPQGRPPEFELEPNGLERYTAVERLRRRGGFSGPERVAVSLPGILARYPGFTGLDSTRVADLRRFAAEAAAAGIRVTAFIPPVHPALARAAAATPWRERNRETVALLRDLEQAGELHYVETRDLAALGADSTGYVDALHFLAPVTDLLAEALAGRTGCAVQ